MDSPHSVLTWVGNIVSASAILGTLVGAIPVFAAFVALIWYSIQIAESATVVRWRANRLRRKLVALHQKTSRLELLLADPNDEELLKRMVRGVSHRAEVDATLKIAAAKEKPPLPDEPQL